MSAKSKIVSPQQFALPVPALILRPCDYGLRNVVRDLELQLGTLEACNRLVLAAQSLREKVDGGLDCPPLAQYAADHLGRSGVGDRNVAAP